VRFSAMNPEAEKRTYVLYHCGLKIATWRHIAGEARALSRLIPLEVMAKHKLFSFNRRAKVTAVQHENGNLVVTLETVALGKKPKRTP
jgi:hypothetical protein